MKAKLFKRSFEKKSSDKKWAGHVQSLTRTHPKDLPPVVGNSSIGIKIPIKPSNQAKQLAKLFFFCPKEREELYGMDTKLNHSSHAASHSPPRNLR